MNYEEIIADLTLAEKQLFDSFIHKVWIEQNLNPRKARCPLDIIIDIAHFQYRNRDTSTNRGELA